MGTKPQLAKQATARSNGLTPPAPDVTEPTTRIGRMLAAQQPSPMTTVDGVARLLGVSREHVRNLTQQGVLSRYKIGVAVRYRVAEVMAALDNMRDELTRHNPRRTPAKRKTQRKQLRRRVARR